MMFYYFRLSKVAQELCVINTSLGLFFYKQLPMGIKVAPDIAQACAEKVLNGFDVEVYLDDCCLRTNGTFKGYIKLTDIMCLSRLHTYNLKYNPLKSKWAI